MPTTTMYGAKTRRADVRPKGHARGDRPPRRRPQAARRSREHPPVHARPDRRHRHARPRRTDDRPLRRRRALEGWSALQFIKTSSITIHADKVFGRCFIDVFSCRPFDSDVAAAIAVEHFGATPAVTVLQR
jgi:hypothetical protein